MAYYGKPLMEVSRGLKKSEKKKAKKLNDYQLRKCDTVLVLCEKCKWISFDHKLCMNCHFQFPASTKVKITTTNKQIFEVASCNIKPIPSVKLKEEGLDQPKKEVFYQPKEEVFYQIKDEVLDQPKAEVLDQPKEEVFGQPKEEVLDQPKAEVLDQPKAEVLNQPKEVVFGQPKEDEKQQDSILRHKQQKAKSKIDKNQDSFQCFLKSVKENDLKSLDEKTFLNDTIIDVYLQYIYHKKFAQDIRERSHIFSTHFFSTLREKWKNAEDKEEIDVESQRDWVSSNMWTKKIDLFSKDFIFIPIHKTLHWYLIVLCYLPEFIKGHHMDKKKQSSEPSNAESNERKPCLYYFDSLDKENDVKHDKILSARYLIEFLAMLWNIKNPDANYDFTQIQIRKTDCPQQNNGYDCGIYVLHFVEKFFKIPIATSFDFSKWFSAEEVKNKRTEVRNLIKKLQEKDSSANHYSSDSDVN